MFKNYTTKSSKETRKLGENLAREVLFSAHNSPRSRAIMSAKVLCLQGDLGSGKTTFLQGFARGLGVKDKVLSPTFIIYRKLKIPENSYHQSWRSPTLMIKYFYHFDCYRINKPEEILELGFKEIISNPKNIIAIEWSERIKKYLPKNSILIKFKFIYSERSRRVDQNKREIFFL